MVSAELRSHVESETPVVVPLHFEMTLAVLGNKDGLVSRTGAGQRQETRPATGTIWMTPIGVGDNEISITAPLLKTMHLYLPTALFRQLSDDFNLQGMPAHSIRYVAGVRDRLIEELLRSILAEMTDERSAGRIFVEMASQTLAARLIQKYSDGGCCNRVDFTRQQLDHVRLRRVTDFVSEHLFDDITLADMARVAGLSTFHFARTFAAAFGVPPHCYVSRMRLDRAMAQIADGKLPLAQIAFDARFSSQSSFTRAFRRATGITPAEYRRRR
jgi:AraC family transcriptional regulator